jgi:ABC-type transporter Mla MlaB component
MSSTPVQDPDLLKEVVEFWSNTSTDWANPGDGLRGASLAGAERTELQAMIARKRHNDAVRLAELNLLRRIRQEGLTGDQIREMERARASADSSQGAKVSGAASNAPAHEAITVVLPPREAGLADPTANQTPAAELLPGGGPEQVIHDTELDQAAIAFANADFSGCESTLRELIATGGRRQRHVPTWRAMLDLYRATGQQSDFERLALVYTRDLQQAPPQWVSIPRLAINMAGRTPKGKRTSSGSSQTTSRTVPAWRCPTLLDSAAISSMQTFTAAEPGTPVLDWTSVKVLTHDGAQSLLEWLQARADIAQRLFWIGTTALLDLLRDTPRTEGRPEDEVLWQLRLAILRLLGVQGPYDLVAMDFQADYGKKAPCWAPTAAKIVEAEPQPSPAPRTAGEFSGSTAHDRLRSAADISIELVGQLTGDINDTLARKLAEIESSHSVRISCARLIRVDLMAAGELLNWIGARRAEGRRVRLIEVHRLLALFFCAMGLNEQATIELRPL